LEYYNVEHHGTQKRRYDWVKEKKAKHFDLRWKEFLPAETQAWIADEPRIADFLKRQHLRLLEDGPTRHATTPA